MYITLFFTWYHKVPFLLFFQNDEHVPVDLKKVSNILLTESSEALHFMGMELVGPLT